MHQNAEKYTMLMIFSYRASVVATPNSIDVITPAGVHGWAQCKNKKNAE